MEEQKLTMFQRNKVNYHLRNGDPLPLPNLQSGNKKQDYEDQLANEIMQRANKARKRSLDMIRASGAFEIEKYTIRSHKMNIKNLISIKEFTFIG